jgi:ubiquitin-like 1-activating enzyme E1 A
MLIMFSQRVEAATARVQSLNPLVNVEALSDSSLLEPTNLEQLLERVDLVCATDLDRDTLVC